jgi:multidrug transporter EmrE-like cation transporter
MLLGIIGDCVSTALSNPVETRHKPFSRRQSIILVFCCTILGAAAQILMKSGASHMAHPGLGSMITSVPLMAGDTLYGLSTLLLILALRDGELSLLYPIIALTYVWVTALSVAVFREVLNPWKLLGIGLIVWGVAVLGKGGRR